jgi:hypothetical protein
MLSNCVCYEAFLSFSQCFPELIYPTDGHYFSTFVVIYNVMLKLGVMNYMLHPKFWVYFM